MVLLGRFGHLALVLVTIALSGVATCLPTKPDHLADRSTPEATLRALAAALAQPEPRGRPGPAQPPPIDAYIACFAESTVAWTPAYHATFDPLDVEEISRYCSCAIGLDWGFPEERQFFARFRQLHPSAIYDARFETVAGRADPPRTFDRAQLHRHYRVVATSLDGSIRHDIAVGFADLTFARTRTGWVIARWQDHVDPAFGAYPADPEEVSLGHRRLHLR